MPNFGRFAGGEKNGMSRPNPIFEKRFVLSRLNPIFDKQIQVEPAQSVFWGGNVGIDSTQSELF